MWPELRIAPFFAVAAAFLSSAALAKHFLPNSDPKIDAWYVSLKQPDNPTVSCCGVADAYWADEFETTEDGHYIAIVTDNREIPDRPPIKYGTKFEVPKGKLPDMSKQSPNPTGHGILFVYGNAVLCYFPPAQI